MRTRSILGVLLLFVVSPAWRAAAQSPPRDIRALSLQSLRAGRSVRVAGRDIGTITGRLVSVDDESLWLYSYRGRGPVPLAGIDSVWVGHSHPAAGALVGLLIGSVIAMAAMSHQSCSFLNSECMNSTMGSGTAILLGGTLLGAVIGSGVKSWELRYP